MNTSIRFKILFFFLIIGLVPSSIAIITNYISSVKTIKNKTIEQLNSIKEIRKENIESYFEQTEAFAKIIGRSSTLKDLSLKLKTQFENFIVDIENYNYEENYNALNRFYETTIYPKFEQKEFDKETYFKFIQTPTDTITVKLQNDFLVNKHKKSYYKELVHSIDTSKKLTTIFEQFSFEDMFIVDDQTGYVLYNKYRKINFGVKLPKYPLNYPSLSSAFLNAKNLLEGEVFITDFSIYPPDLTAPASFISVPLDADNEKFTIIFQLSIKQIDYLMTSAKNWEVFGFGRTGESYILGDDLKMRSDSRFLIEDSAAFFKNLKTIGAPSKDIAQMKRHNTSVLFLKVKKPFSGERLLEERKAYVVNDYRNIPVLITYTPLEIRNLNWVLASKIDKKEAYEPVYKLRNLFVLISIITLIIIIIAAMLLTKNITKPLNILLEGIKSLQVNKLDIKLKPISNDEFKTITDAFNTSVDKLNIYREELILKNNILYEQQKEITASINYAVNIQKASMPSIEKIKNILPEIFVLFKPKDIVSGDFYWVHQHKDCITLVLGDCTGHGVPGAFMSLIGTQLLTNIVVERKTLQPAQILNSLKKELLVFLDVEENQEKINDGIDMAVCNYNHKGNYLEYAGAMNPLIKIQNSKLEIVKADKYPIGKYYYDSSNNRQFTNHRISISKGDAFYIFSDGYQDQFGATGKKFNSKKLREVLYSIHDQPMKEQKEILLKTLDNWMGEEPQTDDIALIGFKITK